MSLQGMFAGVSHGFPPTFDFDIPKGGVLVLSDTGRKPLSSTTMISPELTLGQGLSPGCGWLPQYTVNSWAGPVVL
jgi:hypothetical protein